MQSLAAFMLTLIRQYEKSNSDMWMSIGLLMIRAGFHFVSTFPMNPPHDLSENPTSFYGGMKSENGFYFNMFTIVMYWNLLTVVNAFLYHMFIALNITEKLDVHLSHQ
ncbi:5658_t:CDS:2 [Funneliformis mosseae]|uniref:5658_t:CDS:1 n=1 Tax=Funneliformis mosseae TaxID=27381 RepID=A0A9N9APS8_FUNMO|nr:5658_t:CDS:2 [Funneliformis mosseae]